MSRRERRTVMGLLVTWEALMVFVTYSPSVRIVVMALATLAIAWGLTGKADVRERPERGDG